MSRASDASIAPRKRSASLESPIKPNQGRTKPRTDFVAVRAGNSLPPTHGSAQLRTRCRHICPLLSAAAGGIHIQGVLRMHKTVFIVAALLLLSAQAEARPYRHLY